MKNRSSATITFFTVVLTVLLAGNVSAEEIEPLIKERPHNIYHTVNNKTLKDIATQLGNRSGITFKIDPSVERDVINRKLAGDDWNAVVKQFLQGYNYTMVSDMGIVKTVVITGHNGSGHDNAVAPVNDPNLVIVAPDFSSKLPAKYKNFNAGSVLSVKLPMAELMSIPVGDDLVLDLPIGQYKVKHDNLVDHGDGSLTWVGYLNDEGKGYRVYISQGDTGLMGNVYTPDGVYNIETVDGQTVIVNIEKSGLESAGFEHDEADPAVESMALMDAAAKTDKLASLKSVAESARATADARMAEAKVLYDRYLADIETKKNTLNQVDIKQATLSNAKANYVAARATLNQSRKDQVLRAEFRAATSLLRAAKLELHKANAADKSAARNATKARTAYNRKSAQAKAADANAKSAEAAYAAEMAKSAVGTAGTTGSSTPYETVIDLMVLYTTVNQTADYAKQRIRYLVDVSNQAYKDSGINMSLRLVHTRATSYVENNANSQALVDLVTDKGAFAGTSALRNQYGADLVALFRPLYAKTAGSCGTAYVGFANGSGPNPYTGYGTIGDGYSKDSLSNYYCANNTFTHEIGHNLGNVHDREYSNAAGKFSYSYAWGVSGKFGTVMSYYSPSVMLFSTPGLATQCAGAPCGFAEGDRNASDQTRTINYTAPLVAGYRPTTVSVPVIQ